MPWRTRHELGPYQSGKFRTAAQLQQEKAPAVKPGTRGKAGHVGEERMPNKWGSGW